MLQHQARLVVLLELTNSGGEQVAITSILLASKLFWLIPCLNY